MRERERERERERKHVHHFRGRLAVLETVESVESVVDRLVQSGARGDIETASALNSG